MTSAPSRSLWRGRAIALIGIVLFAFSLRTAVASLSPLLAKIGEDFTVPAAVVGLIGTAPPVCYAVFGIVTPLFERRYGLERTGLAAMVVVAVGLVLRGFAVDATTLLLATALIFAAVGVGNVLLPPLVKKYFPDRIGLVTSVYSTMLAIATFTPPLIAVPVADAASWRLSIGVWAVFAAIAMIPWVILVVRSRRAGAAADDIETANPRVFGRLWRLPLVWALVVTFTASAVVAYVFFAWYPQVLIDIAGLSPAEAGAMLALFASIGMPCSLLVPMLVVRFHATRALFAVAVVTGLGGIAGLLVAPSLAPAVWTVLLGVASLLFPLSLVLLGIRTRTHEGAVALSGFVQSIGYGIAAVFPLAFGLLHDATASCSSRSC
ncbi:CynX/NimT family MFS transporter [Microbacterium sp. NPDC055910]|uniref:MFS transporter n=1 Tax=Microbacterium sp. NPDC055910 TaxID=3345659 RepID=UPI0035E14F1D